MKGLYCVVFMLCFVCLAICITYIRIQLALKTY